MLDASKLDRWATGEIHIIIVVGMLIKFDSVLNYFDKDWSFEEKNSEISDMYIISSLYFVNFHMLQIVGVHFVPTASLHQVQDRAIIDMLYFIIYRYTVVHNY